MKSTSFSQKVLFGVEIVLSLRILLFVIPAMLAQGISERIIPDNFVDWYLVAMFVTGSLYGLIGLSSLLKLKSALMLHGLAALVAGMLTFALMQYSLLTQSPVHPGYWLPFGVCVMFSWAAFALRRGAQ